jgi:hypothetical protein
MANAGMRSEIGQKWSKFTAAEITALKRKEDLVKQVQSKHALDMAAQPPIRPYVLHPQPLVLNLKIERI